MVPHRRIGRLNLTEIFSNGTVRKTALIEERSRPNRLTREILAMRAAHERGVPVPQILRSGRDEHGREYFEMEMVSGVSLAHHDVEAKVLALSVTGACMRLLGSVIPGFGWINTNTREGEFASWTDFMSAFTERYSCLLLSIGLVTLRDMGLLRDEIEGIPALQASYLLHRDIKPGNILRDTAGRTWIVDWENAILGDPLFDLAQFGANYGHGAMWRALRSGYAFDYLDARRYALYEVVALLGTIDFCVKRSVPWRQRAERLRSNLALLGTKA